MKKLEDAEKQKIRKKITEVKLNVEHTKRATMFAKAEQAENAVGSAVELIEMMADAMGVNDV